MRKSGFSAVEAIITLVVVGIIAMLGVVGYNRWKETQATNKNMSDMLTKEPQIKRTSDLDKAATTLDKVDFGDSDASDLGTESGGF
jgi:Tfp pilus assembly protein FimT